ncbi:MAG: aminoacetone oxidase family FAD-binding enzyme [Lachnospiraceae bacterium]|nr:aminoacetone oxidase family FAD-binding enzyme [Lachnospiraceae bacterium]
MNISIIGCGASGMTAAISAIRNGADPECITIYEASDRPGRKILATGNGRCNLGNEFLDRSCFYVSDDRGRTFVDGILSSFSTDDLKEFFDSLGIITVSKNGYLYPRSLQALSVLDALVKTCEDAGVRIEYSSPVTGIKKTGDRILLNFGDCSEETDRVIISSGMGSGGFAIKGIDALGIFDGLGLELRKAYPALCGLKVSDDIRSVAGVRAHGKVTLMSEKTDLGEDEGEIQFTKETVSGIPVFQVSRQASAYLADGRRVYAVLDLMPEVSADDVSEMIRKRIRMYPEREAAFLLNGVLNNKLSSYVLKRSGIKNELKTGQIDYDKTVRLSDNIKALKFDITGTESAEKAQTMEGGISLNEVRDDLELKKHKGIYVAGELLDIDGKCGGYNLYLAWATGLIAGRSAAL